jgi:hypothetical protein
VSPNADICLGEFAIPPRLDAPSIGEIGNIRRPDDFKPLEHGFDRVAHLESLTSRLGRKLLPVGR